MAEQFPPLSAATLAAANQSAPGWRRTIWRRCRAAAGGRGSAGRQRRDPNHRRRLPSGGGAGGPAADQRRRGTFYGLSLRGGAPDPRYRTLPVDGRPEAHILADIAHDYWHIPHSRLVVEDQSTNCGENARFTRTTLENGGSLIVAGSSFRTPPCSGEPWPPSPASGRG